MTDSENSKNQYALKAAKTVHFVLTFALFMTTWFIYIRVYSISYDPRYNLFVAALYAFLLQFFSKTYNCYLVGFSSPSDIAFSQSITCTLCTAALYFSTMIVWNKWKNPLPFIVLLPVQYLVNRLWSRIADGLYFRSSSERRAVLICGSPEWKKKLITVSKLTRGFGRLDECEVSADGSFDPESVISDRDFCFAGGISAEQRRMIAKYCAERGISCYFIPDAGDVIMEGASHVQSLYVPVFGISRGCDDREYMFIKRAFDIFASAAALIVLSPVFLVTAVLIKLDDGGPVFYRQVRLTKDSKEFEIVKFRSMRTDAEKDGVARLSTEHDDRITKIGKFIRACRIDELPQLVNVLKGDMSLVGPRPERPEIAGKYEKTLPEFRLRLQVKAGITGYAQVYGRYDTEPEDKLLFDLLYINRMNVMTDLKLLFATLKILFIKESTHGIEDGKTTASGQ